MLPIQVPSQESSIYASGIPQGGGQKTKNTADNSAPWVWMRHWNGEIAFSCLPKANGKVQLCLEPRETL